jgi:PilZ domain
MRSNRIVSAGAALVVQNCRNVALPLRDRRTGERLATSQLVEFCVSEQVMPAELVNLSNGGAKLRIAPGGGPAIGGQVAIRLLDSTVLLGVTRWVSSQFFGVEFFGSDLDAADKLHYEERGQQMFSMILRQQLRLT